MSDGTTGAAPAPLSPRAAAVARAANHAVAAFARHWLAALTSFAIAVISLATLAPLLRAAGHERLAQVIYLPYRLICHQRADRSFHLAGEQMAFCERDLAIVAGAIFVAWLYGLARRRWTLPPVSFRWALLAALPMAIDGTTQLVGLRESTWELRLLTGMLFSFGVGWFVLPTLDSGFASIASVTTSSEASAL